MSELRTRPWQTLVRRTEGKTLRCSINAVDYAIDLKNTGPKSDINVAVG